MTDLKPEALLSYEQAAKLYSIGLKSLKKGLPISIDMAAVEEIDSAGAALLSALHRQAAAAGIEFKVSNLGAAVAARLALFPGVGTPKLKAAKPGMLESYGDRVAVAIDVGIEYLSLCADLSFFFFGGLFRRRGIRWKTVLYEMAQVGSRAFGVVGLIAFLIGGTMALQSAAQLRQFGANIFVVDLIGVSITRELGPLMAAIVVAGRSGSSVAAEIATMVITEEIDALKTMALRPVRFLVLPKVVAITLTQPILTVLANAAGIFGGFLVAVSYLEISPTSFFSRLEQSIMLKDLLTGLLKSVIFAQLIVTIGALCGLRTRGGADEVGRSTTTSVVMSIFAVIVADALMSLVFYFGD